jgi:phosphonopyruvate decarboxylase
MPMKPEAALALIAEARGQAICVPTMSAAPAWRRLAPDDLSVACTGFMGGAAALGLGLALSQPERRVIVIDGDGSLLMQLGVLATVAEAAPRNLTHFVLRNGVYHTSGGQRIPGDPHVDFALLARGSGYARSHVVEDLDTLANLLPSLLGDPGPTCVELRTTLADDTPTTAPGPPFHRQVERLRTRLGAERVGLLTGEERLNPDAPVLCCTAEAAPTVGDFLAGTGEDRAPLVVGVIAIAVGLLVGIGVFVPLVAVHVLFDHDQTDSFGRGFVAVLGIIGAGFTFVVYKLASMEAREAREAEARGENG